MADPSDRNTLIDFSEDNTMQTATNRNAIVLRLPSDISTLTQSDDSLRSQTPLVDLRADRPLRSQMTQAVHATAFEPQSQAESVSDLLSEEGSSVSRVSPRQALGNSQQKIASGVMNSFNHALLHGQAAGTTYHATPENRNTATRGMTSSHIQSFAHPVASKVATPPSYASPHHNPQGLPSGMNQRVTQGPYSNNMNQPMNSGMGLAFAQPGDQGMYRGPNNAMHQQYGQHQRSFSSGNQKFRNNHFSGPYNPHQTAFQSSFRTPNQMAYQNSLQTQQKPQMRSGSQGMAHHHQYSRSSQGSQYQPHKSQNFQDNSPAIQSYFPAMYQHAGAPERYMHEFPQHNNLNTFQFGSGPGGNQTHHLSFNDDMQHEKRPPSGPHAVDLDAKFSHIARVSNANSNDFVITTEEMDRLQIEGPDHFPPLTNQGGSARRPSSTMLESPYIKSLAETPTSSRQIGEISTQFKTPTLRSTRGNSFGFGQESMSSLYARAAPPMVRLKTDQDEVTTPTRKGTIAESSPFIGMGGIDSRLADNRPSVFMSPIVTSSQAVGDEASVMAGRVSGSEQARTTGYISALGQIDAFSRPRSTNQTPSMSRAVDISHGGSATRSRDLTQAGIMTRIAPTFETLMRIEQLMNQGYSRHLAELTAHGNPSVEVAFQPKNLAFVEIARQHKPANYGVLRISNIPYSITRAEIIAFLGRNARMLPESEEPVHIIMERVTSKTMDAYVEFVNAAEAAVAVGRYEAHRLNGHGCRLGERHVDMEVVGQDRLMADLFPKAKNVRWNGAEPDIVPRDPGDKFNSGFQGFISSEELVMLVKHVEAPQRSPFAKDCPQRPYECLISTLLKYPWHKVDHTTIEARDRLYKTTLDLITLLQGRVADGNRDSVTINEQLLRRVRMAAFKCAGFTERQKDDFAFISGLNPLQAGIAPYADHWPFLTIGANNKMDNDVIEYYIFLIRRATTATTKQLTLAEQAAQGPSEGHGPFGDIKLDYPANLTLLSLKAVAELEWSVVEKLLRKVLEKGIAVARE